MLIVESLEDFIEYRDIAKEHGMFYLAAFVDGKISQEMSRLIHEYEIVRYDDYGYTVYDNRVVYPNFHEPEDDRWSPLDIYSDAGEEWAHGYTAPGRI